MGVVAVARTLWRERSRWEELCDCCGLCCCEREVDECGNVVLCLSETCEFLDQETKRCCVYETRFERCGRCRKVTVWRALFDKGMPPSCAYVRRFRSLW